MNEWFRIYLAYHACAVAALPFAVVYAVGPWRESPWLFVAAVVTCIIVFHVAERLLRR